jgi:repressor LexA
MALLDDLRELAAEFRISGDEYAAVRLETVLDKHEQHKPDAAPRPKLTATQAKVLAFIKAEIAVCGRPPTLREICERFGYRSTNGAHDHLVALERKGYIERDQAVARGIRVLP